MIDSVFLPYVAHYAETPEISIAVIEQSLDPIERRTVRALNRAIEDAINELVIRAESFLENGDAAAIASLSWVLTSNLQLALVAEWEQGFFVGGDDGIDEMKASFPEGTFSIEPLAREILTLQPVTIRNTPAEQAVLQRTNKIAGDFSEDVLTRLKGDLTAAIIAPEGEKFPIGRKELSARIQKTLDVSAVRSEAIARTELTTAYNAGRDSSYAQSDLVTHTRFIAIGDDRTTPICLSRNGMVFVKGSPEDQANTPALHVRCRSVKSPLMPRVNKRHAEMIADPSRNPNNRDLVPLSKGWKVDSPKGNAGRAFAPDIKEIRRQEFLVEKASKKVASAQEEFDYWKDDIAALNLKAGAAKTDKARAGIEKKIAESQKALIGAEARLNDALQELNVLKKSLVESAGDVGEALKKAELEKIKWEQAKHTAHKPFVESGKASFDKALSQFPEEKRTAFSAYLEKQKEAEIARQEWFETLKKDTDSKLEKEQRKRYNALEKEANALRQKDIEKSLYKSIMSDMKATSNLKKGEAQKVVNNIFVGEGLPEATTKWMKEFVEISGKDSVSSLEKIVSVKGKPRAYASHEEKLINAGNNLGKRATWHEMGHFVEQGKYSAQTESFVRSRALSQEMQQLNKIQKVSSYEDYEKAYLDKFYDPYVGKVYYDQGKASNSEVLSMGIQEFISQDKFIDFYAKDPDHFFFTVGAFLDAS